MHKTSIDIAFQNPTQRMLKNLASHNLSHRKLMDPISHNLSPKVEGCTNIFYGSNGNPTMQIAFATKEKHEEKWESGQHFHEVGDGKH